jgi:DNA primase
MTAELIPREFIQQLLARVDIVDFIDSRMPLRKKSSNNYFACCPFHAEKSASFSVSQNKQFYYCFGCGAHGNAIDFLMQYDKLSFPEAIESLAKLTGMEIPRETTSSRKPNVNPDLYDLLTQVSKYYQTELRQSPVAIEYLKKRGLSGTIAKDFGIGYAPPGWDHVLQTLGKTHPLKEQLFEAGMLIKKDDGGYYDRFRERIMFPIQDRRGRTIGFGGRILDKGEPKYLNSPETPVFQKSHELYGLYQALQANRELKRVLIVEGYMDVIALFQMEISYAVATLGTATNAHHLQRLFKHTSEIVFCFDGDQAGRTAAWRALLITLPIMRDDIQIRFMFLPDNEDPDTLIRKEGKASFEERIQNAATLSHFFFQNIGAQTDLSTTDGRARFVKLANEHLQQLPNGIFQTMMLDELAKRARINITEISPPQRTEQPARQPFKPKTARSPSSLRLAITLLVQEPELANALIEPLPALDIEGMDLLIKLIDVIQANAITTTGGLLEHFRDSEDGKLLAKFAHAEHMIPLTGITLEFLGSIDRLKKLANKQMIETMLSKAAQDGLTLDEKQYLHELIHDK